MKNNFVYNPEQNRFLKNISTESEVRTVIKDELRESRSGVSLLKRVALMSVLVVAFMIGMMAQAEAAATRFYLQNGTAAITPAIRGTWNLSTTTSVIPMARTKAGTITSRAVAELNATNNYSVLLVRAVSEPIIAKTIPAGSTLNWAIGAMESSTAANMKYRVHAYVVSSDGLTLRGTLLTNDNDAGTEWPTTPALGRGPLAAKTLTAVTTQANDRVIIEVGYYAANTVTTSYTGTLNYGGTAGDMTVGGANTLTGWFEFSEDLFSTAIAPTDLAAPVVTASSVDLTWTADLVNNDLGYDVYRNGVKINASPVLGGTYTDSTVAASTTYNAPGYQVMGLASGGNSSLSTGVPVTTPAPVNNTTVGALSYSGVTMSDMTVTAAYSGDDNNTNTCTIIYSTSATYTPYNTATASRVGKSWVANISGLNESTLYYIRATFNDTDAPAVTNVNVDGSQSTTASLLIHNSANVGTKYGTWGATFTCATCHIANPANGNIKRIAPVISTRAVTATNAAVYGANNTTHATSTNVCEVCHTQPTVHKYNQPVAVAHYTNDCTSCHTHTTSFGAPACLDCHETGVSSAPIVNASSPHVKVLKTGSFGACEDCHAGHTTATGGVDIPNNATVGINYITTGHSGIQLGGTGTNALISALTTEAQICWACHDNAANAISEWGQNTKQTGSTVAAQYDYGSVNTSNWVGAVWTSAKPAFAYKTGRIQSTHSANTAGTSVVSGTNYNKVETLDTVGNIRCSYCHDVHDTHGDPLVAENEDGKPFLRGTWFSNPYEEDGAPQAAQAYSVTTPFGAVPRGNGASQLYLGGFWIDINNVVPGTAATNANGTLSANPTTGWTVATSAGLCTMCHGATVNTMDVAAGQGNAGNEALWLGTNGHANAVIGGTGTASGNAANIHTFRGGNTGITSATPIMHFDATGDRPGDGSSNLGFRNTCSSAMAYTPNISPTGSQEAATTTNNWGTFTNATATTTDSQYHKFSCSKCHNPHASRLPKLMITNCLDTKKNTWDNAFPTVNVTNNVNVRLSNFTSAQNCHRLTGDDSTDATDARGHNGTGYSGAGWNNVTPW